MAILKNTKIDNFKELLLTNEEAANYLGLKPQTLNIWRTNKRYLDILPYIKVGRHIRYRKSSLDNFLSRQTVGGINGEVE